MSSTLALDFSSSTLALLLLRIPPATYHNGDEKHDREIQELDVLPIPRSSISLPPITPIESYHLEDNDAMTEVAEGDCDGQAGQDDSRKNTMTTTQHEVFHGNSYPPCADLWSNKFVKENESALRTSVDAMDLSAVSRPKAPRNRKDEDDVDHSQEIFRENRHEDKQSQPLSTNSVDDQGSSCIYSLKSEVPDPGRPARVNFSWALEDSDDQGSSILYPPSLETTGSGQPPCNRRRRNNTCWAKAIDSGSATTTPSTRSRQRKKNARWAQRDEPAEGTITTSHNNLEGKAMSPTDGLSNFCCSFVDGFASYPPSVYGINAGDAAKHLLGNDRWKQHGLSSSTLPQLDAAELTLQVPWCHPDASPPSRPQLSTSPITTSLPQPDSETDMSPIHCRCSSAQMHSLICSGSMGSPSLDDNNGRNNASEQVASPRGFHSLLPRHPFDILDYDDSSPILPQSKQGMRQALGKVDPQEAAIHPKCDDIKEDRAPLPRLRIRGRDPIKLTRLVNELLQRTAVILDTWSGVAASYWMQVVRVARQLHNCLLSLSPALRVSQQGSPNVG